MAIETATRTMRNYVGGAWTDAETSDRLEVTNPATGEMMAEVPLSGAGDVDRAVRAAREAFPGWRATPPLERARACFELKYLLEERKDDLARLVTQDNGKAMKDAAGEVRRGIECVEVATGIPSLMQGANLEDVSRGIDSDTEVGPVISGPARERILEWIDKGLAEGGELVLDGRGQGSADGHFLGPTIIEADADAEIAKEEIFGPVLTLVRARDLDHALEIMNASPKGNAASIFTTSGGAMRKFRYEAQAGMIGVNIGVAAPMSFFPFTGWKDSFFGDLHAHGRDAIEFYTEKKVVITRWPKA